MTLPASETAGVNAMAEALIAGGHLSPPEAARLLAQDIGEGESQPQPATASLVLPAAASSTASTPPAPASADAASTPALADIEIDPLFAPPAKSEDYRIEMHPGVPTEPVDLAAIKTWFHTARLPQPIAQSLYSEVERMQRRPPDAAAIAQMTKDTRAELARHWGGETDTMLGHAKRLIDEVAQTHPYIKTALARGPGSNPVVVRQLAEHAARLYGQQGEH